MILLLLLLLPMGLALGAMILSKGSITWKEFLLHEGAILLVIGLGYGIALWSKTGDIEHWNGVIATKTKDNVTCCHDYCCSWGECCSGSGKEYSCSTCCKAYCKEHSHDIAWNSTTSNDENVFHDGCNAPSSGPPDRWTQIVVGEPTSVEHSFDNYIKGNPDSILRRQGAAEKWKGQLPDCPQPPGTLRTRSLGIPMAPVKLLFTCTGPPETAESCFQHIEVPFDKPLDHDELSKHLRMQNWYLSVVTAPGQGDSVPIVFATICEPCAKLVMPEVIEAVKKAAPPPGAAGLSSSEIMAESAKFAAAIEAEERKKQ